MKKQEKSGGLVVTDLQFFPHLRVFEFGKYSESIEKLKRESDPFSALDYSSSGLKHGIDDVAKELLKKKANLSRQS